MRNDLLVVQVISTNMKACCPLCFCPAERRHSQSTRLVADLPCAGFRVQLILHVRRFFCDEASCIRKITTRAASRFCSAMGTSDRPSRPRSSISWSSDLRRVGNPTCCSSCYSNITNNDPSPSYGASKDTKPYDAGQGWSVPVTEKESKAS